MAKKILVLLVLFSLIAVPFTMASAITSGVGVIGDSASEPYRCIDRGNNTSFTWTEELARLRKLNFGPGVCQAYNQAGSGETITFHMTSQATGVLKDFRAGKIGRVIIFLGSNDLYSGAGLPDVSTLLATYKSNLNRLLKAGIAPKNILLIDVPRENGEGSRLALVDRFNAGLRDLADEKGTAFSSFATFYAELACRSTDGGSTYNIGGHVIYNRLGDDWHNLRLADGHSGTLANGLLANALTVDFLGVSRMSDAELLSLVNATPVATSPLPTCKIRTTLRSIAAQDGWILESSESSSQGGRLNSGAASLYLGDDAQDKQYRSILAFRTNELPDNAVITKVTLKVKRQATAGNGNPVDTLQGFIVDLRTGFFGSAARLQKSDFQTSASKSYGPFKPGPSNGWYTINLTRAKTLVNKRATNGGVTQIRLGFKLDDNNNNLANYLNLYSGDAPADSRPKLIIVYYVP